MFASFSLAFPAVHAIWFLWSQLVLVSFNNFICSYSVIVVMGSFVVFATLNRNAVHLIELKLIQTWKFCIHRQVLSIHACFTHLFTSCASRVGRGGDKAQKLTIGSKALRCKIGNIIHELGHAVGFFHEHSRPDRNKYVRVLKKNILPGKEHKQRRLRASDKRIFIDCCVCVSRTLKILFSLIFALVSRALWGFSSVWLLR